jgi:fatty-acyl-CoA synthase
VTAGARYPQPETLRDVLLSRSLAQPERLAYDDGARRLTFGQLAEGAEDRAAQLVSMGVRPGDRVALVMSAGIPFAEAFWALQLLGATSCSFNPVVPAQTLERRIERIRPRLVLTDGWRDRASPGSRAVPDPHVTEHDIAFMQPTSGTSGEPRAAMISHGNVVGYLRQSRSLDNTSEDDILVAWVPPWHDLGLIRFVVAAVYYGAACHIVPPAVSTIPQWLQTVSRARGTFTGAPDFAYRLACRMVEPASVDLSSLRYSVNGGEPVRSSTIEQFERRFGLNGVLQPGYGLAEVTLGVASRAPGDPLAVDSRGNVSCGVPLQGVEVRASGDASEPGEILVRTDYLFAGYFDAPDESREIVRDGWLTTGDVGYRADDGQLYVLGRSRAMLKRGGGVIAPRELEEAAHTVEGVRQAAAVSVPAEAAVTEVITVVVEATPTGDGPPAALAAEVSQAIVATLGFGPGEVVIVPPRTVPLTANGKVRYDRLRAMLSEGVIGQAEAA